VKFESTHIKGAYIVHLEPHRDDRGFFSRAFCDKEFAELGLTNNMVQTNICRTFDKGILRGMHYQDNGHEESKFVRCISGTIFDVIIDLRKGSDTYCQWLGVELSAVDFKAVVLPEGCAHGYLTLEENSDVIYQVSAYYSSDNEYGVRWNDPIFGINWPIKNPTMSEKDANHPDFVK
jgi:dTDP-4-dehydrorhamnose 3,5-epimerase